MQGLLEGLREAQVAEFDRAWTAAGRELVAVELLQGVWCELLHGDGPQRRHDMDADRTLVVVEGFRAAMMLCVRLQPVLHHLGHRLPTPLDRRPVINARQPCGQSGL